MTGAFLFLAADIYKRALGIVLKDQPFQYSRCYLFIFLVKLANRFKLEFESIVG